MSVFSDTSTKLGLLQICERKLFGDDGYGQITENTNRLYQFTERINRAQDRFCYLAMTADGRWQWDDDNYTDFAIATTSIVSGQNDYTLNVSHLGIEKVLIKDSGGTWQVITPLDQNDTDAKTYLENNSGNSGTPTKYDKRGNSLLLINTPNYNSSGGLKIYFRRGASYFVYIDTTKVPGFASIFHSYLANHASTYYALDRTMKKAKDWYADLLKEEEAIKEFFSTGRNKDEQPRLAINNADSCK